MRRTRFDIVVDIICTLMNGGANKTRIVYNANLNFHLVEKYLKYLKDKGLISEKQVNGKTLYFPTEKGVELVQIYRRLSEEDFIDGKITKYR
ncbi:winged helix-turn-helix domain-containing protein [Geoglobus acetivorans]|uniref:Winged helix-turn-helix domain-containing protein n=1 Tax=Geoglobus acetivorans TaxID=565033 RepID=A0ABZ3H5M5_GEOAI|nr:winged helix-turn-helix domain-containing protein [Geoglobus acetivorans]